MKRNLSIGKLAITVLLTILSLGLLFKQVKAAGVDNVITSMSITDGSGNPLTHNLDKWETFRINANFALPNNTVNEGDTTTVTLPSSLKFSDTKPFAIKDSQGNIVANATIDSGSGTVTLTYTKYAEEHSDITGSFFLYAMVDHDKITTKQEISVDIGVEGKIINAGTVTFNGIGTAIVTTLTKSGWIGTDNMIHYQVYINRSGHEIKDAVITDTLRSLGIDYQKGTFKIEKGVWTTSGSSWILSNRVDVTNQFTIDFTSDMSFKVNLGDIAATEGYAITYDGKPSYTPVDGEIFSNSAELESSNIEKKSVVFNNKYIIAGGQAEGYVFAIQLKKVDEAGQPLLGAKFRVVRDATNQVIGEFTSDSQGLINVTGLLKDNYTITEIEAPSGYQLLNDSIKVTPDDFNASKTVTKEVANVKTPTTTTTTTTTTSTTTTTTATTTPTTTESTSTTTASTSPTTTETTTASTAASTTTTTTETTASSTATTESTTSTTATTTTEATTTASTASTTVAPTTSTSTTEAGTTHSVTTRPSDPKTSGTTTSSKPKKSGLPSTGDETGVWLAVLGGFTLLTAAYYYRKAQA